MYYSLLLFLLWNCYFRPRFQPLPPPFSRFALAGLHMSSTCPRVLGFSSSTYGVAKQRSGGSPPTPLDQSGWRGTDRGIQRSNLFFRAFRVGMVFFCWTDGSSKKKRAVNHQKMMMMMNFRSAQLPNHQKIYTSHKKHNTYKKCSNSSLLA